MNEIIRYSYICDGEQTVFEYLFEPYSKDFIKVYIDDELVNMGYVINPFEGRIGGKVVFLDAPLKGQKLTILRELAFSRVCDYQTGGALRAEDLNYELNYNMACLKQVNDNLSRVIKLSYPDENKVSPILPPARSGCAIVWNEKGDGFKNQNINISEQVNYIEDCVNYVEKLYNDLTDIVTNSLDVGILGLINNLFNIMKVYHPNAFADFRYISDNADVNLDYGFVFDGVEVRKLSDG